MPKREQPSANSSWEEIVARDPLVAFSWYLAGRISCVREIGNEVLADLDGAISDSAVDGTRLGRAEMLMWFWTLGAYEVIRTMCQAKECFSDQIYVQLKSLKKELAHVRMPAAKMEMPGEKRPVTSDRSPAGLDLGKRDLLIGDPTTEMTSARRLLKQFDDVVSSITPADVRARHEDAYEDMA